MTSTQPFLAPSLNTSTSSVCSNSQDDQPKKKRKSTVRACDACAIRKVKCEAQRPCHHCVANNLNCTQLRERKKSGPKNLHKKTLTSINNFNENHITPQIISSEAHPIETVPENLPVPIEEPAAPVASSLSKFTTNNLIENLQLINDPIIRNSLRKLAINSILNNYNKFIEFIRLNLNNFSIDLLLNSGDLSYLSNLMIVFSLNLIIIEILIKMNNVKLKKFTLKSPTYYKNFKNLLMNKMADLAGTVDKMFLLNNPSVQLDQIFYNISSGSLNMYAFNSLLPEQYRHQKLLYLRKAITYFQLIRLEDDSKLSIYQVYELYQSIYANERTCYLLSSDSRLFSCFVVREWNKVDVVGTEQNLFFEIAKLLETDGGSDQNNVALKLSPSLVNLNKNQKLVHTPGRDLFLQFRTLKVNMVNLVKEKDVFNSTIIQVLIFKVLVIYSNHLSRDHLINELKSLVGNINLLLQTIPPELMFNLSTFQILPHLFQILKVNLDFKTHEASPDNLIRFTGKIIYLFPTSPKFEMLIKQFQLQSWFEMCKKKLKDEPFDVPPPISSVPLMKSEPMNIQRGPSSAPSTLNSNQNSVLNSLVDQPLGSGSASILSASPSIHQAVGLPPNIQNQLQHEQLDQSLTKLKASEMGNSYSGTDHVFDALLQDFGNSRLSSNSSTNNNSNRHTPELDMLIDDKNATPNLNSGNSYSTLIQYQAPAPVPPVMTAAVATNNPKPDDLGMSESTKNLYSLFNQINDDFSKSQNSSLTNLFQFNNSGSNLSKFGSQSNLNLLKIESANGLSRFASFGNLTKLRSSTNFNGNSTSTLNQDDKTPDLKEELKKQFLL